MYSSCLLEQWLPEDKGWVFFLLSAECRQGSPEMLCKELWGLAWVFHTVRPKLAEISHIGPSIHAHRLCFFFSSISL